MQSIESLPSPSHDIQYQGPVHPAYRSDFGSPSLVKSGLDLDSLDLLGNLAELQHPISITRTKASTPDLSVASDSSESIESLSGAESPGCDDEPQKSYFEDDDFNDSEVHLLSEVQHEASSKDVTEGFQALSQTGYVPSEAGTTIRQPRAIYPVNTVRFNLDVVNNSSRPRSEAEFNSTPASEADSVMAMSISSLPMLKTPLTQTVKLNDKIASQMPSTTLLGDGGSSAPNADVRLSRTVSKVKRLDDLLEGTHISSIESSTMARNSDPFGGAPPALPSTPSRVTSTRNSRMTRVISRSKSFPNIIAARTAPGRRETAQYDTATANAHFMAELRSCVTEVITRVFLQLLSEWNGHISSDSPPTIEATIQDRPSDGDQPSGEVQRTAYATSSSASLETVPLTSLSKHLSTPLQRAQTPS
ncbi:hypothetical protein CVT26_015199 [Gymnopilus dilepis]|uniref:Uncharacterized protein n=1 Tax=Gymnopilus dilepis TaxID=231916 RepID=A0A409WS30_9AGAR|nr:hypothetical protein CVT26_015199 [Gymnopilus dilepis]